MYQNMYNNPAPMGNYNPYEQNVSLLKNFFSKPIIMILAVLNGVSLLLAIISFFMQMGTMDSAMQYYTYVLGNQFSSVYSTLQPIIVIVALCSLVFTLLTALGYFFLNSKSKNPDPQSNPAVGAKILWVLSIIKLVFACIGAVILIIFAFILFAASSELSRYEYGSSGTGAVALVGVRLIFLAVFLFFISFVEFRFFSSVNASFNSVEIKSKSAIAFAVFSIIAVVGTVISLFSSMEAATFLSVITNILNIVLYIALAVFAISYNSFVKSLTTGGTPVNGFMPNNGPFDPYNQNPNGQAPNMNMGYSYRPQQPPVNDQFNQPQNSQQYQNPYGNPAQNPSEGDKTNQSPYFSQQFNNGPAKPQGDVKDSFNQPKAEEPKPQNKCPMCGAVYSDDDMFCGNCGAKLK